MYKKGNHKLLALSLLLAVVFATSFFLLPRPSVVYAASNDAISYDSATKTVTIQGNCDTDQIYAYMHADPQDPSSGTGKDATTLHFAGISVIKTIQYDPTSGSEPDLDKGPFAMTQLENITADSDAHVSFVGKESTTPPVLTGFFASCMSLLSIDVLSSWDVGNVNGDNCMSFMFYDCGRLTSLDGLSAWDVGNVNGDSCMSLMFYGCTGLTSLDGLSAWDVSGVNADYCMEEMFRNCTSLTSLDGLSAWDVSGVNGDYCMEAMFYNCTNLTSLDGLSAWEVGNVNGDYCMSDMFSNCTNLVSLDAIAGWNIDGAISSSYGVFDMFRGTKIASITLGGANGFKLDNDMSLPSANWWPVDNTSATTGIPTTNLVAESKQDPPSSLRWQRCATGTENPMRTVTDLNVVWPQTNADKEELIYNGLFQTLGTKDDKVQVTATIQGQTNPVALTEGADFYVVYKDANGIDTTAIKDAGNYSARIVLRGAYIGQDSDTVEVTIKQLDLASDAYSLVSYTLPSRFPYTGNAHTPKTMVRLYLRDDPNPASTPEKPLPDIPIYTYLIQYSSERTIGDYSVSYANNTDPGTATATLSPAIPEGRAQSNLTNTTNAYFAIGDYFVTFDSCGGTPVPEQGTVDGLLTKPKNPIKEGYVFTGWYTEDSYIHKWDFATDTLSSNITLYAKWEVAPEPGPSPDPEPTPGTQDGWVQSDAGWQYVLNGEFLNDGWHYFEDEYGNHWYYFDNDTYMATSRWIWDDEWEGWYWVCSTGPIIENLWQWIDNAWYGFWWGGKMCQGWVWDTYYNAWYYCDDYTGRVACNEWAWDGAWYYFDQNCQMLSSCWVGPYWLNASGQWV